MDEREFELRSRSTERLAAALSVIAVGAVLIAMLFAAVLLAEDSQHVADPVAEFGRPTGLELPEGARFVAARDTHGGMHGEGELKIAFDVDASTIERWLKRPAPFGDGAWKAGDIPRVPAFDEDSEGRRGDSFDEERLSNVALTWSGEERAPGAGPWSHADLIAIDPSDGRVYFCRWDN
jgi:hypothetical protein